MAHAEHSKHEQLHKKAEVVDSLQAQINEIEELKANNTTLQEKREQVAKYRAQIQALELQKENFKIQILVLEYEKE
jgi:hypothetical protein